ncbi:unnamed protein product [Peniophora sp. CBMAI 1063]|nr:unnamed protein product [Peniophora sp. CBMAI 1063]
MSLSNLTVTHEMQVLTVLYKFTASTTVPLLLLESVVWGILCAGVPLGSYLIWIKSASPQCVPSILALWTILVSLTTHWVLSLRQLESILSGRALGIERNYGEFGDAVVAAERWEPPILVSYDNYASASQYLFPLVTESVFFGFASFLFAVTACTSFWQFRSRRRSSFTLIIPATASLMYLLSLAHWAISIRCFAWVAGIAARVGDPYPFGVAALEVALLAIVSFNAVMSDSIVLWRMFVVWDRVRPVLALGATLIATTVGLNLANIVINSRGRFAIYNEDHYENVHNTEVMATYGGNYVGLAAAFLSLMSNLSATVLVGIKFYQRYSRYLRSDNRRTLVERFMMLLVDSGIVYTAIWVLNCISFFRPITSQVALGAKFGTFAGNPPFPVVAASGHLDAAMAQITSVYPFVVFILVVLDTVHHSRGPHNEERPKEREPEVTFTLELDMENCHNVELGPPSTHSVVLQDDIDSSTTTTKDDTKIPGADTHR